MPCLTVFYRRTGTQLNSELGEYSCFSGLPARSRCVWMIASFGFVSTGLATKQPADVRLAQSEKVS
jgi:hypothetical protein